MQLNFKLMLNPKYGNQTDREKCDTFTQRFLNNVGKYPHIFNFSTDEIEAVKTFIATHKIPSLVFYKSLPDANNLEEFPAYQIPIPGIDNLLTQQGVKVNKLKGVGIAKDFSSDAIIVTKKFKELMGPLCKGLKWEALQEDCYSLIEVQKLQDPIQVVNALEIRKNAKPLSTFTITGDGRKVISSKALERVSANGLVRSALSEANGEIFKSPDIFIVSAPIMQQLLAAKFKHISKHILPILASDQTLDFGAERTFEE